ncbi:MAG: diaminopimelate epimerase [Bacteroidota bacterium]
MHFCKYQGAGNDFVMLDQRSLRWISRDDTDLIARLCDRRYGIGADGLILLQSVEGHDFEMIYFNSDGRESTLCGNGGRCIAVFARDIGVTGSECRFLAIDGAHEAVITSGDIRELSEVSLKMADVRHVTQEGNSFVLNTGSPHFVRFDASIDTADMVAEGRAVRYSQRFRTEGINVNLVSPLNGDPDRLKIRTYERGVEDETLACGTGVTAAAIAAHQYRGLPPGKYHIPVQALGGNLSVRFTAHSDQTFTDIWLCGPAAYVFEGDIQL